MWAVFLREFLTNKKPQRDVSQVVVTVGVNSRTVPVRGLHMNINFLYQVLLWMQLNQC
jgi:hypothetical protein